MRASAQNNVWDVTTAASSGIGEFVFTNASFNTTAPHPPILDVSSPTQFTFAQAGPDATSGAGSSNHLLGARLEQVISAGLVHVPYRGAGPAMVGVSQPS